MAPLVGCVLGTTLYAVVHVTLVTGEIDGLSVVPFYGLAYAIGVGIPSTVLIGLPMHFALSKLKISAAPAYVIAGLVGGALTVGIVFLLAAMNFGASYATPMHDALSVLPLGLLIGACVGLTFWLIRGPDRDAAANPPTSAP